MTTSNPEFSLPSEPAEELTTLQLLRKECGQEYTEADRQLEKFVIDVVNQLKALEHLLDIIEKADAAKREYANSPMPRITIRPNSLPFR